MTWTGGHVALPGRSMLAGASSTPAAARPSFAGAHRSGRKANSRCVRHRSEAARPLPRGNDAAKSARISSRLEGRLRSADAWNAPDLGTAEVTARPREGLVLGKAFHSHLPTQPRAPRAGEDRALPSAAEHLETFFARVAEGR